MLPLCFMITFAHGIVDAVGPCRSSHRGALALALALFVGGCSSGSAVTPGVGADGYGGQGVNGAGGGVVIDGAGGAGGATPVDGAGGQGGGVSTIPVETCDGVPPAGIGVPPGTVATASSSDDTDPSANAIDGDVVDEWSSGTTTAWITLTFPTPTMIGAIRFHADAKPANNEIFTLSTSTSTVPLASFMATIPMQPGILLPEIKIPAGVYRDITITVNAGSSWAGINEIWVLPVSSCP